MEVVLQLVFMFATLISLLISEIQMITIIAISFILGTGFGTLVTVSIIKSFHIKHSSPDTEELSASRQDTLRFSANNTTEPTYLNVNYSNQWDEKIPVQDTPVYAEVGPGNDLLVGLPQGPSAPPRI